MTDPLDFRTLSVPDRTRGELGIPPATGRTEISYARLDGVDVVIKAASGAARDKLRREAEILQRLADARVTRFVDLLEGPDHTELITARHSSLTLNDAPLMAPGERTAAVRSMCRAIADLHDLGWTHGRISADHVLVGRRGNVRLCSLGSAHPLSSDDQQQRLDSLSDRNSSDEVTADHCDVAAVASMVLECDSDLGGRAERLRWRIRSALARRRLARIGRIPTPEELSALLGPETLTEPVTADVGSRSRPRVPRLPNRRVVLVAVMAVVAVTGSALLRQQTREQPTREQDEVAAAEEAAVEVTSPPPLPDATPRVCLRGPDGAEVCTEEVRIHGQTISVGHQSFELGQPGDELLVADWRCDGSATAALLRPSTAMVYEFPDWADGTEASGREESAQIVGNAPEASTLTLPLECGSISLLTAEDSVMTLELPGPHKFEVKDP